MANELDVNELVAGLHASGLNVVLINGSREETSAESGEECVPAPSPDVLCWTGLTVANVKTEFPNLDDGFIRDFLLAHKDGICEAMSNAAMDYVINNIGGYRYGERHG